VERLIGSIRRDGRDQVVVLEEGHLRKSLKSYREYYHRSRTHFGRGKDAPEPRIVQPPELGGRLHHRYERRRHSPSVLFGRSLTLHLAVASLKKIWQANRPIPRSAEKITPADSVLEIEPKRTSSGRNFTTAKFWRTTPGVYLL
jgi:hypothetical protein